MKPEERLGAISEQLRNGEHPPPISVRAFLSWFGAQRRGYWISRMIRRYLEISGLATHPDFEGAYLDSEINFRLADDEVPFDPANDDDGSVVAADMGVEENGGAILLGGGVPDPTHRIGKLAAANNPPIAVGLDTPIKEAVTLMLLHDFSQLPVMQGERVVKGLISWQSVGSRLALNCAGELVRNYMVTAVELSADASLFAAISAIVEHQYVLIRGADQKITGIVTTSDLSLQFQQLAEPFLLLGEIENHVRRLIDGKFTTEEVKAACELEDTGRDVQSVADLTFGEYIRLLENPKRWQQLNLDVDRLAFIKHLDRIREIRNDVMHFDPDGVAEDELSLLRKFVGFLQTLRLIGAT